MQMFAETPVSVMVASPDGMQVATIQDAGRTICIWDAMTGASCYTLPRPRELFQAFLSLAWSPDRRYVAAGTQVGQVCVWQLETRTLVSVARGYVGAIQSVAWSPDGSALASASKNGRLHVWTASSQDMGLPCYQRSGAAVCEVAWSPDGSHLASCWQDGRVRIWQVRRKCCVYTYRGHSCAVRSCVWSLDGTRIASAGEDGTVQVWRVPLGDQWWRALLGVWGVRCVPFVCGDSPVTCVRWSPDGSALAALREDRVCLWRAADAIQRAHFSSRALRAFCWSRGGTQLLIAGEQHVEVWSWRKAPGLNWSSRF